MGRFESCRGSLTVEASIALPVFICVIMSIAFFMKVFYVHEIIQHAISDTASEISTYSYIYSVSGIQKLHDETADGLEKEKEAVQRQVKTVVNTANAFREVNDEINYSAESVKNGDMGETIENLDELNQSAEELEKRYNDLETVLKEIANNPKQELKSLACAFARTGFEDMKAELILKPMAKAFMVKHLKGGNIEDADKRLMSLNVVGGFDGLDFSQSRLFEDKKHIDIIVRYRVKLNLPINVLPELNLVQRTTVRAWLDGEGAPGEVNPQKEDIWALSDWERGRRIQEMYGRNLPENFKTLTKFENGVATVVTSINLNNKTYQDNKRAVVYRVTGVINSFINFKEDRKTVVEDGKTVEYYVNANQIKEKRIIVVIPKGSQTKEFEEVLTECRENAQMNGINLMFEEL